MKLLRPMEPVRGREPFDDTSFLFQLKWDGIRILAHHDSLGETTLFTRRLRLRTNQYPEIAAAVAAACRSHTAVLDGEAVVLRDQRPWFPHVLRRDRLQQPAAIVKAQQQFPVLYAVFDVLHWRGQCTMRLPLEERIAILKQLPTVPGLVIVDSLPTFGKKLFALAFEQQWEGIVAKRIHSVYTPEVKSDDWVKIKRSQRHLFAVIGYAGRGTGSGALLLGAYRNGALRYCGRVGTGLSAAEWNDVIAFLRQSKPLATQGPWPPKLDGTPALWVQPQLTVWVDFLDWTDDLQLRHPVIVGFSSEKPEMAFV